MIEQHYTKVVNNCSKELYGFVAIKAKKKF